MTSESIAPPANTPLPDASARSSHRRTRRAWILSTFALLLVGGLGYWVFSSNVEVIASGRVYKSKALSSSELLDTVKELGIRTVVDLRETPDDVKAEADVLATVGVDHVNFPTPQVPSEETVREYLEFMDDESHYPVLIHCQHGTGRAQLFSALYRIEYEGWDNDAARCATRPSYSLPFSSFDLGEPKGEYLEHYVSRAEQGQDPAPQKSSDKTP